MAVKNIKYTNINFEAKKLTVISVILQRQMVINKSGFIDRIQRKQGKLSIGAKQYTVCPRRMYPIYIASYCIKWVIASWTYSTNEEHIGTSL